MLGFTCVQEFTCKYQRLVTAMVLPHCILEPRCKGVLVLIAKQMRKPIATWFSTSFLRIYTHVYLTEDPELANSCIELVVSCTQSSLQQLMNADVKVGHCYIIITLYFVLFGLFYFVFLLANGGRIAYLFQPKPHIRDAFLPKPFAVEHRFRGGAIQSNGQCGVCQFYC